MDSSHLPSKPIPAPGMEPTTLKRKRNLEDEALQRLMIKREKKYLSQQSGPSYPPLNPPWSMQEHAVFDPLMTFQPPPIHMDPSLGSFDLPLHLNLPPAPVHPSNSKYALGIAATSIGGHSLGDYPPYQQDMDFEWGFNSDDEQNFSTEPATSKSKKKKNRKSKKKKAKRQETVSADVPSSNLSDAEASEAEEGEIVTFEVSDTKASSSSPPPSSTVAASSLTPQSSWSTTETHDRHSPPSTLDPEELVEMARARLKACVADLKELMNDLDGAKTKEEKMKILVLVKAKDGEITMAQEAIKAAESEQEAVKLMNHAVSLESNAGFNDPKMHQPHQARYPGRHPTWNTRTPIGLASHLRFLRISSPIALVIELDDDDDGWDLE
ncbi:hypothetical protein FRB90_002313 [Tulasnella sp. 427]|nr:hypothetical protein FRB90_002313 [Tulasnella sp. 427]